MRLSPKQKIDSELLAKWNDEMVLKYHRNDNIPFLSRNPLLRFLEIKRLKKIIKLGNINRKDKILDLGCGEGFLISLLPKTKKIIGVDISKIALKRAKKLLKHRSDVKLCWGDAQDLKFPNNFFDKIICSETLEHLPFPEKAMKEIHRLLKKNGIAIISIPDEKRIEFIMKIIKRLRLTKFLYSARQDINYEWHLYKTDRRFIVNISKNLFKIEKICRIPPLIGHHLIAVLRKK